MAFRFSPSTPAECLSQTSRRKKRSQDDTFQEILQASGALNTEHRAWRITIADSLGKYGVERRKMQEKERDMQQDILGLLRKQRCCRL